MNSTLCQPQPPLAACILDPECLGCIVAAERGATSCGAIPDIFVSIPQSRCAIAVIRDVVRDRGVGYSLPEDKLSSCSAHWSRSRVWLSGSPSLSRGSVTIRFGRRRRYNRMDRDGYELNPVSTARRAGLTGWEIGEQGEGGVQEARCAKCTILL
jgi:hypothetical protein